MSSGFYDRFETGSSFASSSRRTSSQTQSRSRDCDVYVQGIPLELDKAGLENIFCKAGRIENVRIIPPKNQASSTTYGFITFANKAAAAVAIETFNNYKFGRSFLIVRYAEGNSAGGGSSSIASSVSNSSSAFMTPVNSNNQIAADSNADEQWEKASFKTNKSIDVSQINESTIRDSSIHTIDEINKIKSMGRGILYSPNGSKNAVLDLSRPYAKKIYEEKVAQFMQEKPKTMLSSTTHPSKSSIASSSGQSISPSPPAPAPPKPVKTELVPGQAYPINITHVNSPDNFFIELKSTTTQKANLMNNLDNYYRNNMSSNEFSSCESNAYRCKLHNVQPIDGKMWSARVMELFYSLKENDDKEILEAKIYSSNDYEIDGHVEKFYSIDILFAGDDSVIEYLLDCKFAIEKKSSSQSNIIEQNESSTIVKQQQIQSPLSPPSSMSSTSSQTYSSNTTEKASKTAPLKEKDLNIMQPDHRSLKSQDTLIKPAKKTISTLKLVKNQIYTVVLQYFDEQLQDQYFYLGLRENAEKLNDLDIELQLGAPNSTQPIISIKEVKVNDYLEALFDLDQKWYRVKVTEMTPTNLSIYFLDFGNTQTLSHEECFLKRRLLRKRVHEPSDVFDLEYQAVKCCYRNLQNEISLEDFLAKLSQTPNSEVSFDIIVNEVNHDNVYTVQLFDLSTPTSADMKQIPETLGNACAEDQENDDVFSTSINLNQQACSILTMSEDEIGLNLDSSTRHQSVITVVQTTNVFFVQANSNLKQIIDHQMRVQKLADLCMPLEYKSLKGQSMYQIGDLCIAQVGDSTWYRAVVLDVRQTESGDFLYDVFFADYGNTDKNLSENFMYSIGTIKSAIRNASVAQAQKTQLEADLKQVIELPFQAVCCRLFERKECTRNTEILKALISACANFNISIREQSKHFLTDQIWIKQYVVNLYSDDKLLDDQFEAANETISRSATSIKLNDNLIEGEFYTYKLSHFGSDTEIYVNLADQLEDLCELQTEINNDVTQINKSSSLKCVFKPGDLVLAKFFEEDRTYNWYRARILSQNGDLFNVLYIDYGNTDASLTLDDLRPLPAKYSQLAQFAYNIRLNGVKELNFEQNQLVIAEYASSEVYKLRVVKKVDDYYLVELWNTELTESLNKLLNTNYRSPYDSKLIETHSLNDLFRDKPVQVRTKYMFIEDFKRPFYFCLEQDMSKRDELALKLNDYYNANKNCLSLENPQVNDYCAIFSDNAWYRGQIKLIDATTKQIRVFFIDYGYEESLESADGLRRLVDDFEAETRFIFGAYLLQPNSEKRIEFQPCDDAELTPCLEEFFTGDDELDLVVKTRITKEFQYENEFYFGIEMLNKNGLNLNQMIVKAKQDIEASKQAKKKPKMPDYIRLKLSDMPEQVKPIQPDVDDERFMVYSRDDLVFIFQETKVVAMQESVSRVCSRMLEEREKYEDDILQLPAKGDLVYAKYADDQKWYRCLITNCNQVKNLYELFFIDFGNTEINPKEDILYGWTQEHVELFKQYAPVAYKAKLV